MKLKNKWIPNLEITLDKLNQNSALKGFDIRWLGTVWGASGLIIETVTGSGTLTNNEQDVVLVNAASAASITLMSAVGRNRKLMLKKIGAGDVTFTGAGAETIDGNANIQLRKKDAITLVASGGNWWIF